MGSITARVEPDGAVVLSAAARAELGVSAGGEVRLSPAHDPGAPRPGPEDVARLRVLLHPLRRAEGSGVQALLLERRIEAALEELEAGSPHSARRVRTALAADGS